MEYNKLNTKWLLLAVIVLTHVFTACEDDNDLGSADRLFRPVVNETSFGGNWINYKWDKYDGVNYYELQLSADSFETFIYEVEVDTNFYKFENLEYDTDYYLRIKSVGDNLESKYFVNDIITTSDFPTKLNSVTSSDVIDTQAKITWAEMNYDSLLVYRNDTLEKSIILTDANNAAKQIIVKALTTGSPYVVKAYFNGKYQGKKGFMTADPQVFEGDVLDLRDTADNVAYSMLDQVFFDQLAIDHPNGVTVVLSGGTHYELGGTILKAPLNLVTGYSLKGKAIIEVKGNFDTEADGQAGNIHLEKLAFTDHPEKPRTESNYGGTYIMNVSGAGSVIDTFSIEDCDIRYKRGVLRIKTGATVKAISINNCVIDSIAGYGVVNLDNSDIITNSISVTNSTITNVELFVRTDKMAQDLENLTISNLTTYYTPKSQFFRMGNISNVEITDCLFGAVWDPEAGAEGLRSSGIGTSKIQGNYRTSDCNWPVLTDSEGNITGEKNPIESTQLSETSPEIFEDIDSNDYTITDSRLVDRVGDPRWW